MSHDRKENSALWKVLGAAVIGALIGIGAGIFGTTIANNDREADLLTLRKRSQVKRQNS
jgi:hypothetical protein